MSGRGQKIALTIGLLVLLALMIWAAGRLGYSVGYWLGSN